MCELRRPEGVSDSLELEWQVAMSHWMWVPGIKLWPSDRAASTLTTESSLQSLSLHLFLFCVCVYICISVQHTSSQAYLYVTPWNPGLLPWSSQMETGEKYSRKRDKYLPVEMDSIRNLILQKPTKNPVYETITPLILGIQVLIGQWKMIRDLLFKVCSLYHILW